MKTKIAGFALVLVAVLVTTVSLRADDHKVTLKGYLIDKACSTGALKAADPAAKAKGHKKGCALMDNCAASGYGIVSDGKYYAFDKAGNEMAAKWLKATEKTDNLGLEVVGTQEADGTLKVESLTEMK
jgi:hypothetical protein